MSYAHRAFACHDADIVTWANKCMQQREHADAAEMILEGRAGPLGGALAANALLAADHRDHAYIDVPDLPHRELMAMQSFDWHGLGTLPAKLADIAKPFTAELVETLLNPNDQMPVHRGLAPVDFGIVGSATRSEGERIYRAAVAEWPQGVKDGRQASDDGDTVAEVVHAVLRDVHEWLVGGTEDVLLVTLQ